jgi:hypothetical protein
LFWRRPFVRKWLLVGDPAASLLVFAGHLFSLVFFFLTEVLLSFEGKCLGLVSVWLKLLNC